jgi:hypothetical protein
MRLLSTLEIGDLWGGKGDGRWARASHPSIRGDGQPGHDELISIIVRSLFRSQPMGGGGVSMNSAFFPSGVSEAHGNGCQVLGVKIVF